MPADYTIQLRRGTAAQWTAANPVLKQGELGLETDTKLAKIGDGTTVWNSLAYWNVGGGGGSVVSVFGRAGAVVAQSGDYTAAQVGADAAGAAAAEQTRALAAEALLAPKASPTFTGTPIAPTATPLTNTTQVATTAYADAAVAVEKSRAQTAEGLLAPLASPALTGSPTAPTQLAGDSSTKIATDAFVAAAVAAATVIDGVTVSGAAAAGNVITATSPTTAIWQTPAGGVTLDTTAADIQPLGTQAAGAVGKAADSGHVHPTTGVALLTGAAFTGPVSVTEAAAAGGILTVTNTTAAPTAPSVQYGAKAAADLVLGILVTLDTNERWTIDSNGKQSWGTGAAVADVTLARTGTNLLSVGGFLGSWSLAASGLTGAVNPSRYGGAVNGAAPASGAWVLGDWVIDRTNATIWVCTTAGSPGTWTQAGRVTGVTAADGSIVVGGTAQAPTIATGSIDQIASAHPVAAAWSNNGHAITSVTSLGLSGLTGATAATRYVGATASGAPSGANPFNLGDFTIDQTGSIWVCTAAGSPGTWVKLAHLNASAGNIVALGAQAAGSTGLAADAGHVHPTTGLLQSANNLSDVANTATALSNLGGLPKAGGTMTGWLAPDVSTLTFVGGGTTVVNAALANAFNLTLTASTTTLGNPSNPVDGQVLRFRITQGTGGSFTLAYGTAYDFGASSAPTLSTAATKVDILAFEYVASISKWCYLGAGLGY